MTLTAPGHDEAWRVQAALDARGARPQVFRVGGAARRQRGQDGRLLLTAPPVGGAVPATHRHGRSSVPRGALFSYRVPEDALPGLAGFLASMLWMRQTTTEGAE